MQERNLAQIRELQEQQSDLISHKNHIEQEFSNSFKSQQLYKLLEQKLSDNPDCKIYDQINLVCEELTPQVDLNRVQLLKLLFELKQDTDRSNQDPISMLKEKQTEIESRQVQLLEQMKSLDAQLQDLDVNISSQTTIDIIDSKSQGQVNTVQVNSNQLLSSTVQEFNAREYESLGQLRRTILISLCNSMLLSIDKNKNILTKLKTEILTYNPDYQKGLDCIEEHWHQAVQRQELLEQSLKDIKAAPDFDTLSFSWGLKKLVNVFDSGLAILVDEYDSTLSNQLDISSLAKYVRQVMEEFYVTFKDLDVAKHLNLIFVTGVTAYAKVLLFSGANKIYNISYHPNFNNIIGLTEHEIVRNFAQAICKKAILNQCTPKEIVDNLVLHSDVYHFNRSNSHTITNQIFNTHSVIQALGSIPTARDNN